MLALHTICMFIKAGQSLHACCIASRQAATLTMPRGSRRGQLLYSGFITALFTCFLLQTLNVVTNVPVLNCW